MTKLWLLLISMVLLTCALDDEVVPCPADDQKFSNCFTCKQVHRSQGNIYCACTKQQFKMLGSCLSAEYPCKLILTNLMYNENEKDKGFNIWDTKISALLSWKFEDASQTQTLPDPLPQYMNDLDFLGMPEPFREGWGQAYFFYLGLQNQIKQLDSLAQDSLIVEALKLYEHIKNKTYEEQWSEVTTFVNLKLHTHWSVSNFTKIIQQRVRHLIPCHGCTWLYGFLHIKSQNKCYKCPPGCTVCQNNTSDCLDCLKGFFLNKTSKQCQRCAVGHCENCSSQGVCYSCQQNMLLYENVCHHPRYYCSSNCQSCQPENPHHCTACSVIDYSIEPNKQDKKCFKCDQQSCMMCTPNNTSFCWECLKGFYGDQHGNCKKCMDDCLVCQNQHNCTQCRYGFSLHNNTCSLCEVAGCKFCPNDTKVCQECLTQNLVLDPETKTCKLFEGATLNYHFLEPKLNCSQGCVFCYNNNTEQCHTCDLRYFLDTSLRICKKCMAGCIQCQDQNSCTNCQSGYYHHNNSKCSKCPAENCHCKSDGKCKFCFEGYEPHGDGCKLIMEPYGCQHFDPQNATLCKICEPGFAKTLDQKCVQCSSNCKLSCNPHNISECTQSRYQMARPYYYLNIQDDETCFYVNGNCVAPKVGYEIRQVNGTFVSHRVCFHPCLQCDKEYVCSKCKNGYKLVEDACVPDISCNPKCQHCLSGSHRDPQTHACVLCSVPHCSTCYNTTCFECNQGFYLQTLESSQSCKKCSESCKICLNSEDCSVCAVGYFRQQQMKCQKCSQNCLSCDHLRTKCLSCRSGSRLIGNRCVGLHSVQFYYRLKGSADQFMEKTKSQQFITELSTMLQTPKQQIFILNTTSKPLSISGLISTQSQNKSLIIFTDLQHKKIQNFEIECNSFGRYHQTQRINYYSNLETTCQKKQDDGGDDGGDGGLGGGAIAAIVVCCGVGLALVGFGAVKAVKRFRARDSWSNEHSNEISLGSEGYYQQYMDSK